MKARLKGTDEPFQEVASVCLRSGGYILIKDVEFEQDRWQEPCKLNPEKDLSNPIDHWQDVRERAAIAVLPQCLKIIQDVLWRGGSLTEETITKQAAVNAVDYADELVKKLKGK